MFGIILIICMAVELYCFQKQRAILEIGRVLGFDVRKLILPPWFIIMWVLPFITMYCISETFSLAWYYNIFIYFIYMILYVRLPIMKSFYINALDKLRVQDAIRYNPHVIFQIEMLYEKLNVNCKNKLWNTCWQLIFRSD